MNLERNVQTNKILQSKAIRPGSVLQRKCACGQHTPGGGICSSCDAPTHKSVSPSLNGVLSSFDKTSSGSSPGASALVQAKLNVGPANDRYEQEADRVADAAMSMSVPSSHRFSQLNVSTLQRAGEDASSNGPRDEQSEDDILVPILADSEGPKGRSSDEESSNSTNRIQRKVVNGASPAKSPVPGSLSSGQGDELDIDVRTDMENRIGSDFSGVRIHTGSQANTLCESIAARAFTHHNHIYFSDNAYRPNTNTGKHLLAHELTHTIQQGASPQNSPTGISQNVGTTSPSVQRAIDTSVLLHTHSLASLNGAAGNSGNSTIDANLRGIESAAVSSFGSRNPVMKMHLKDTWRYYADSFGSCRTTTTQSSVRARLANCAYTHYVADDLYDFNFSFTHTATRPRTGSFATTSGRSASRTTTLTTGAKVSYSILELSASASSSSTRGSTSGTTVTATNFFEHDYDVNLAYNVKYFLARDFRMNSDYFPGMDQVGGPSYYRGSAPVGSITLYDDDSSHDNLTP